MNNEEITKQQKKVKELKEKLKKEKQKLKLINNQNKSNKFINMLKKDDTDTYKFKEVLIIMLFSLALGFFTCFSIITIFNGGRSYFTVSKDLDKFIDSYYTIVDNYYGDLNKEDLVNSAIEGMINSVGDVYTNYSDSNTTTSFLETVEGIYEGIGCTIAQKQTGEIVVIDMFDDGPSAKAGLMIDDIILKVDDIEAEGKTTTELSDYIKNTKNKNIIITVLRNNEEKEITVVRDKVEVPTVTSEVLEKNNKKIGYMSISIFSSITDKQFNTELEKLQKENIEGLIIDVRGNGGGYLSSVTNILNRILEKDKVIYQLESKDKVEKKKDTTKECLNIPIAVLTNTGSASASEILASAIKESYGGYVVGTNTYGKGTVQQTSQLPDGSMLKYTVQNWLTPNGNWVNEVGLEPTDYIELSEEYYNNPNNDTDSQLQKALELLTK